MEDYIMAELQPTDDCGICTEHFSEAHRPVALKCRHIFGHQCLLRWMRGGRGNNNSCPFCRSTIYEEAQGDGVPFETTSIWNALCDQSSERLNTLMVAFWRNLQRLRDNGSTQEYTVQELLDGCILPALVTTAGRQHGPFEDAYSLIAVSYASLGHPDTAQGLAIPLIRLARLMNQTWYSIPNYLATLQRFNMLFWEANACIGLHVDCINWTFLNNACTISDSQSFALLHLYTVLMSQIVAHHPQASHWPTIRHEQMNLIFTLCCNAFSTSWKGTPSIELKDRLAVVFEELKRHQEDVKRISLRGNEGEEDIVRGLWQMARWGVKREVAR